MSFIDRRLWVAIAALAAAPPLFAAAAKKPAHKPAAPIAPLVAASNRPAKKALRPSAKATPKATKAKTLRGPWRVPTFADSTEGDRIDGDDLTVRRAAVEALGKLNGTVVVADPQTGRILTIVNQKLALRDGFQPCSTVKVPVALAALSESVVERDTRIRLYGKTTMSMTEALAKSNNQYFASLGQKLGFERVSYYARLFGLGEKAGLDIEGEQAGLLPPAPPKNGMGMMTSFGDGIALTPLELTALVSALANGGNLNYLQYPKTQEEAQQILPRIKRHLDIEPLISEIKPGMHGAVQYGTARRIGADFMGSIFGKTGTCTDERTPTHLGWFGSFAETSHGKLAVVVLLTGGTGVSGPAAAMVAGSVYKTLEAVDYLANATAEPKPPVLLASPVQASVVGQ
ncbi:MAG: penicillin-binding protein [Bryobacterales bacterium]|nr:penicillin-binding protein [Bryobacterales bacterium]